MCNADLKRCSWAGDDPLYQRYHDQEWGLPCRDDRTLFEFLVLEGAQAGLAWITILRKRENYRAAFDHFDAQKVAGYSQDKIDALLADPGIVRNRLKVASAVSNAQLFLDIQAKKGSFAKFIWQFVEDTPVQNSWQEMAQVPVTTEVSDAMSKELKRLGFKFVGSTICYAYMQATGMVNDHLTSCFRHAEVNKVK
ncbi:MAG: DNA-3-methyladenine glycosylase I [Sedimenticola sp.]